MRAGKIFVKDLLDLGLLEKVSVVLRVAQRTDSKSPRSELLKFHCMLFISPDSRNVKELVSVTVLLLQQVRIQRRVSLCTPK